VNRDTVETHLMIIRTWASFALEKDHNFFEPAHLRDIARWMDDALELLKEQDDMGKELTDAMELIHKKNERIKRLEEQIETLTKWRANAGAFD